MELKRYVLTKTNEIVDLKEHTGFLEILDEVKTFYRDVLGVDDNTSNDVIKTSDNILDLVEVGDLVELKNDTRMFHIHNQRWLDDFLSKVQEPEEDEFKIKDNIVAIYKRQPNGDYKRYEVK